MKKIIPAILTDSPKDLKNKLIRLKGLIDWVQIDIMDGKFTDNVSIQIEDLGRIHPKFNLEIHLMVQNPEKYFQKCQKAKAKRVIFHLEAVQNLERILKEARKFDFQIGIALNPETAIKKIKNYLNQIDLALLLTVHPGAQGQKFIPQVLDKIKELREISSKIKIGVDGGLNLFNIKKAAETGADYLVVGSGLWETKNIKKSLQDFSNKFKIKI